MGSVKEEDRCGKPAHVMFYPDVPCRLRKDHEGDHEPLTPTQSDAVADAGADEATIKADAKGEDVAAGGTK